MEQPRLGGRPYQLPSVQEALGWLPKTQHMARRMLILSDIHANWHALTAVLKDASQRGCDGTMFLGDIVGYGTRPVECVELLMHGLSEHGRWVAGNHDLGVTKRLSAMPEMFGITHGAAALNTWEWHAEELKKSPHIWDWFVENAIPERATMQTHSHDSFRQLYVHSNPVDKVGSNLFADDHNNLHHYLHDAGYDVVLGVGHTHMVCLVHLPLSDGHINLLPITYGVPIPMGTGAYLFNPGSVGQPRDGDQRAAYAVLDTIERTITFYRVPYRCIDVTRELRSRAAGKCTEQVVETLVDRIASGRIRDTDNYDRVYRQLEEGAGIVPINRARLDG